MRLSGVNSELFAVNFFAAEFMESTEEDKRGDGFLALLKKDIIKRHFSANSASSAVNR